MKILMFFEMEECRADKNWAHFYLVNFFNINFIELDQQ